MASISLRSSRSRRPSGLATRSSTRNNVALRPGSRNGDKNAFVAPQLANIGRKKRPRDADDQDDHLLKAKRSKIAIEILPPPKPQPQTRSVVVKGRSDARSDVAPLRSGPQPAKKSLTTTTTAAAIAQPPEPAPPAPQKPTKHHLKVANGIRHEIDKLQPSLADLQGETRKLRSQEGTRFKSELSAYFPEYDEVIGNEPKEERKSTTFSRRQLTSWLICARHLELRDPHLHHRYCEA